MDDADVVELGRSGNERIKQERRCRCSTMQVDPVTGADPGDSFGGADDSHALKSARCDRRGTRAIRPTFIGSLATPLAGAVGSTYGYADPDQGIGIGDVGMEERTMTTGRTTEPTVESVMTVSPVVVAESETIPGVAELLAGYEISGLPVVDAGDRLVGVISQTDLVRLRAASLPWAGWHGLMVRDLMSWAARTIDGQASLDEAARRMADEGVNRLIVVDDRGTPVGVLSESDLVREIADACDDC